MDSPKILSTSKKKFLSGMLPGSQEMFLKRVLNSLITAFHKDPAKMTYIKL
jgi:hypothetical protein